MAQIGVHPAPGLGELMAGWFDVPQNPMKLAQDGVQYVPTVQDVLPHSMPTPDNPVKDFTSGQVKMIGQQSNRGYPGRRYKAPGYAGVGEIMAGNWDVPQNPLIKGMSGLSGGCGGGCGCGGSCGCGDGHEEPVGQLNGQAVTMGDINADLTALQTDFSAGNYMSILTDTIFGVPVWTVGAMLAIFLMAGGKSSHVSRARRAVAAY